MNTIKSNAFCFFSGNKCCSYFINIFVCAISVDIYGIYIVIMQYILKCLIIMSSILLDKIIFIYGMETFVFVIYYQYIIILGCIIYSYCIFNITGKLISIALYSSILKNYRILIVLYNIYKYVIYIYIYIYIYIISN